MVTTAEKTALIREMARNLGGSLDANSAYLLERSLKTLSVRVGRQSENALYLAEFLERQDGVIRVFYPGLPNFPGHNLAKSQMRAFGGMLSFELDEQQVDTALFLRRLKLITPAVSLGGVESTICAPAVTSHVKMSAAERKRVGISDNLFRLSVGIEHREDLMEDLAQALNPH